MRCKFGWKGTVFDMTQDIPYFMTNKEWYTFNETEFRYELTALGSEIKRVRDSYDEFYAEFNGMVVLENA